MSSLVVVVRRDLFGPTEPFIVDQALSHNAWDVVFLGDHFIGPVPDGSKALLSRQLGALAEHASGFDKVIVHAHFAVDAVLGLKVSRKLNAPLATTLHGFDVTRRRSSMARSGKPNLLKYVALERRIQEQGELFLAVSSFIKETAIERGYSPERTVTHHMGIPILWPWEKPGEIAALKISHVARLVPKKGTDLLLRALAELHGRGLTASLDIVGDGPERERLVELADALGVSNHVAFLGRLDRTAAVAVVRQSDAFCLPSRVGEDGDAEGLGMVLLEAAAVGTPIVATASGGIVDFVTAETGMLASPEDVPAIADCLEAVILDRSLANQLSVAARRRLERDFDVRKQTIQLEHLFDKASGR